MKKRIMVLLCCMIIAVAGCGNFSPGNGRETVQAVEKSLGEVSYRVPEDWVEDRDQVTGNIYYRADGYVLEVSRGENVGLAPDALTENKEDFAASMVQMIENSRNQFPRMLDIETVDTVQLTDNNGDLEYGIREIADMNAFEARVNFLIDDAAYEWHANVFIYGDGIYFFIGITEDGKDYSGQYDTILDSIAINAD